MKKVALILLLAVLAMPLAGCDACKTNPLTDLGNTIATLGKEGLEKEKILAERNASRAAKCAEQKAEEMKKKMGM